MVTPRTPIWLVIMTMDYCSRTFGNSPCLATGEKCFNTFPTCKYKSAYSATTKDYKFTSQNAPVPFDGVRPYITDVKLLPTEIKTTLTVSGRVSVKFTDEPDRDVGIDPYLTSRSAYPNIPGTFWKKWITRNRNYKGRTFSIYEGWYGEAEGSFDKRWQGRIDNVTLNKGEVTVEAVDLLKDLSKIEVPPKIDSKLNGAITAVATTLLVTNPSNLPSSGYLIIDQEVMSYSSRETNTGIVSGLSRGLFGTTAAEHSDKTKTGIVKYYPPQNAFDLMKSMLLEAGMIGTLVGWSYRKAMTLSRPSGAVANYQVRLLIGESSGATGEDVDCGGLCRTDFGDLRFTKADGDTLLDYWIESVSGTTPNQLATVWVEFDSIGVDATKFYMYYGNASATSASNGVATFPFFDDFEDNSLDGNRWVTDYGSPSETGGQLICTGTTNERVTSKTPYLFGVNYAFRVSASINETAFPSINFPEQSAIGFVSGNLMLRTYTEAWGGPTDTSMGTGYTPEVHVFEIRRNSTVNVQAAIDDAVIATNTTNIDTSTVGGARIGIATSTSANVTANWALVRQYLETGPSSPSWGAQESASSNIDYGGFTTARDFFNTDDLNVQGVITEPTKLDKLYFELVDLFECKSWVAENLKVTIARNIPYDPARSLATFSDAENILHDSASADLNEKGRLTRVVLYWEKTPAGKLEEPVSYGRVDIAVDVTAESASEYGEVLSKTIYCRWITTSGYQEEYATAFARRLVMRKVWVNRDAMPLLKVESELKDEGMKTGDFLSVTSDELLDRFGVDYTGVTFQIVRRERKGNKIAMTIQQVLPHKVGFIHDTVSPNEWASATETEKKYGYICADDSTLPTDVDGYYIY